MQQSGPDARFADITSARRGPTNDAQSCAKGRQALVDELAATR
jgi:hypothetical protein